MFNISFCLLDLIKDGLDKDGVFKCLVAEVDSNLLDGLTLSINS